MVGYWYGRVNGVLVNLRRVDGKARVKICQSIRDVRDTKDNGVRSIISRGIGRLARLFRDGSFLGCLWKELRILGTTLQQLERG